MRRARRGQGAWCTAILPPVNASAIDGRAVLERVPGIPAALRGRADVWLVGGAVRDTLLGREPREVDLVVEGDAIALARELGRVQAVHERFGTATVAGADLASARTETYPEPGSLPEVRLGATAGDDLARRDFTVNAIAVRLADGEVAAWPGAVADLATGVLRVLHDRSFEDDPTRLLRLARYAARLGFRPDAGTARLAAAATVATVSPGRLGEELRLLLGEPLPAALEHLEGLAYGRDVVHPALRVEPPAIRQVLHLCPAGEAALAASLTAVPASELRARLDALAFPAPARDTIVAAATRAADLAERLADVAGGPPSAIWAACRAERLETVAVAGGTGGPAALEAARRWLGELRATRLAITGHDLVAAGLEGAAVGEALDRARAAALDGRAPTRDAQLAAALGRDS